MEAQRRQIEQYGKVHLIGIGGVGMSGIAEYLAGKGVAVTGSDLKESPITRRLEKFGVKIREGHSAENIDADTELVIYTSALDESNPELVKSQSSGITTIKRAQALGDIVNTRFLIGVSGTHGKTTTTAMIAKILIDADMDPTVFVGGVLDILDGGTSRIGSGDIAVVEADEYDRSFLRLTPDIIVITNIDPDHLDIYSDVNEIIDNFKLFLNQGKSSLKVIACGDDKDVICAIEGEENCSTYGFEETNDHRIMDLTFEDGNSSFTVDGSLITLRVPGAHNVLNSTAAFLVSRELKLSVNTASDSLREFRGVNRRLELKYENGVTIFDDYAHHPAEVKASLDALRKLSPKGRIISVFQPHLYTRTKDFYKEFAEAFGEADMLLLAKIYPAREKEIEGVTSKLILNEYFKMGRNGLYFESDEELMNMLESISEDGDVIVFQGAGDISIICENYVRRIVSKKEGPVPL